MLPSRTTGPVSLTVLYHIAEETVTKEVAHVSHPCRLRHFPHIQPAPVSNQDVQCSSCYLLWQMAMHHHTPRVPTCRTCNQLFARISVCRGRKGGREGSAGRYITTAVHAPTDSVGRSGWQQPKRNHHSIPPPYGGATPQPGTSHPNTSHPMTSSPEVSRGRGL